MSEIALQRCPDTGRAGGIFPAIIGQRIIHRYLERITIINHVINTHPRRIGHLPVTGSSNPAKGWINQRRARNPAPKALFARPDHNPGSQHASHLHCRQPERSSCPNAPGDLIRAFADPPVLHFTGWVGSALLRSALALPCLPSHSDAALATLAGLGGRDAGRATGKSPAQPSHGLAVWQSRSLTVSQLGRLAIWH